MKKWMFILGFIGLFFSLQTETTAQPVHRQYEKHNRYGKYDNDYYKDQRKAEKKHYKKQQKSKEKYYKERNKQSEKAYKAYYKHREKSYKHYAKQQKKAYKDHERWYYSPKFYQQEDYVYFPNYKAYYDPYRRGYVYQNKKGWMFSPNRPGFLTNIDLGNVKVQFVGRLPF